MLVHKYCILCQYISTMYTVSKSVIYPLLVQQQYIQCQLVVYILLGKFKRKKKKKKKSYWDISNISNIITIFTIITSLLYPLVLHSYYIHCTYISTISILYPMLVQHHYINFSSTISTVSTTVRYPLLVHHCYIPYQYYIKFYYNSSIPNVITISNVSILYRYFVLIHKYSLHC